MKDTYYETAQKMYQLLAPSINQLYQYYRDKDEGLEDISNPRKQLDILVDKKYIGREYLCDFALIVDYLERRQLENYLNGVARFQERIEFLLDR